MPNLDGMSVGVFGRNAALYDWPVVQVGVGPAGQPVTLKMNADGSPAAGGSQLPYGADTEVIAYYGATNNIETVKYYLGGAGGTLLKTRTFTYAGGGAANDDLLTETQDA